MIISRKSWYIYGYKKRVSAFLLAVLLSFGVCAVDYLQVDALEVGGSVVWDTAINYLLGLLGLSPITENGDKIVDFDSMRSKWVQDYEAYFYANVKQDDLPEGYTKERAYNDWINNVCRGNLNTVEYGAWDIFKEWAETLPSEGSSTNPDDTVNGQYVSLLSLINYLNEHYITGSNKISTNRDDVVIDDIQVVLLELDSSKNFKYLNLLCNPSASIYFEKSGTNSGNFKSKTGSFQRNHIDGSNGGLKIEDNKTSFWFNTWGDPYYYYGVSTGVPNGVVLDISSVINGAIYKPSDYAVVNDKISDLQIINDYSTTTTQNVVSIDWDRIASMISDATGTITGSLDKTITDALDGSQEKVAAGTMSVANYNDYVTEISNTYVYDITNETSITNPDSTVTGVISGNVENAEFVLNGLQYVFPFCIPWDIKDFVTLLVADPVAPVIEYPIYNPVTDTEEIITIDFSLWENQVRIIRYIFDFLLIIGLLLLARSLIGAGGGD